MIVAVGEENNCGSVHVPFLLTTEKLQKPILGFNVTKVIMDAQKNTGCTGKDFQHVVQIQIQINQIQIM